MYKYGILTQSLGAVLTYQFSCVEPQFPMLYLHFALYVVVQNVEITWEIFLVLYMAWLRQTTPWLGVNAWHCLDAVLFKFENSDLWEILIKDHTTSKLTSKGMPKCHQHLASHNWQHLDQHTELKWFFFLKKIENKTNSSCNFHKWNAIQRQLKKNSGKVQTHINATPTCMQNATHHKTSNERCPWITLRKI